MSFWNFVKLTCWWARFAACGYLIASQPQVDPMAGTECVERLWTDGCLDEAGSIGATAVRPVFYSWASMSLATNCYEPSWRKNLSNFRNNMNWTKPHLGDWKNRSWK